MPGTKDDEKPEPVKEFREGDSRIRFFDAKDRDGERTTVFALGRDGPDVGKLLSGGLDDLRRAKSLIIQAEKELSRQETREWWHVVKVERLIDGGAVCRVEKSLPDADRAERFAWKTPFAVFPRPSGAELQPGEELVIREGDDKRLDRRIRQLRWREENKGEEFAFGRWHARGSVPKVGDPVNIEALHDYQGEPRDHRITPLKRPVETREPQEALFLVIRRHPTIPGLGTVEDITSIRKDAIRSKDDRQASHDAKVRASDEREWREQDMDPELRRFAPGRGDDEPPPGGAAPAAALPPPPRHIVVGSLKAEVFEMTDADGRRQRTVKITRSRDGVEQHFECDLGELLEVARQVNGVEKAKGQVKERLRDVSAREPESGSPKAEGTAKEAGEPRQRDGHARAAREAAGPPGPPRQAAHVQDNPHWLAGIWHGAVPPHEDQPMHFTKGAGRVQDRVMTPVEGEVRTPGPSDRPHYVIGKVVGDRLAIAHASSRKLDLIVPEVGRLQRQAERTAEAARPDMEARRDRRRENGLSMGL